MTNTHFRVYIEEKILCSHNKEYIFVLTVDNLVNFTSWVRAQVFRNKVNSGPDSML